MECVKGALKNSFIVPEISLKPTNQHAFVEDLWIVDGNNLNVASDGISADDLFVDDLLDFSKADQVLEEGGVYAEHKSFLLADEPNNTHYLSEENVKHPSGSLPDTELCVPVDELAHLEWLSNFVDDSTSSYSLTVPAGNLPEKTSGIHSDPESQKDILTTPFQTKAARSKRLRSGVRVWSLGSNSLTDSSASSSSSSSFTTSTSSPLRPWMMFNDFGHSAESFSRKPPAKKKKVKPSTDPTVGGSGGGGAQPRRCSHCLVQKTPQWRAGPLGAKTLCNACGVRYKSGRLLPEYRPACSPTFSSEIHSNNHRKVLEMRRKKEDEDGFAPPVQSF